MVRELHDFWIDFFRLDNPWFLPLTLRSIRSGLKGVLLARIMEETFKVFITNLVPNGVVSLQMVKGKVLNKVMRRKAQGSSSQSEENKGKKGKSKEKDDDDDRVTITTGDDLVILRDFESMGINGVTKVIDVGDVFMQTNTRMQLWLRGFKHALDDCFNLIFVHMLNDGSYDNDFGYGKWKLTKGNLVVDRGEKIPKLYWTKALVAKDSVNAMDMEASLWHRRLSHISEKRLNCLTKKDILPGLKNAKLEKYSHCMAGKQTRVSFKKHTPSRKLELLELVHSDVCGPLKEALDLCFEDKGPSGEKDNSLSEIDPVQMPVHDLDATHNNVQNGEQHNYVGDQQLGDGFDVPLDDDAEEKQEMSQDENMGDAPEPPLVQLKRSNRSKHVNLRYHWIRDALDVKLLELAKIHTDDNGAKMVTKMIPRGNFEAGNLTASSTHIVLHLDSSNLDLELT
ncbi:hypothetical protein CR513_52569, partial [Mucuna pruriens]